MNESGSVSTRQLEPTKVELSEGASHGRHRDGAKSFLACGRKEQSGS